MPSGPRVLVLSTYYPSALRPGFGTFVHEQATALSRAGASVRVIRPLPHAPFPLPLLNPMYREAAARGERDCYQGIEVEHRRYLCPPRNWMHERVGDWMVGAVEEALVALHERWPFDVINAHTTYPCGYAANRIRDRRLPRVPVVHTVHRASIIDTPRFNAACEARVRESLRDADASVFVSREGLAVARELCGDAFRREPVYITNGVDPEKFALDASDEAEAARIRARHPDATRLLFVGAACERKGTWELLDALRALLDEGRERLHLWMVGPNLVGRALPRRIRELGLSGHVSLVGPVAHDAVKVWMDAADLFVLPSHSEGVATVLFEALHAGLPSVFTKVGGTADVVTHEESGLLVPPRSVPALRAAIARLLDDAALRDRLGSRGRELVLSDYTWQRNAERNLDLFDALRSEARAPQEAARDRS